MRARPIYKLNLTFGLIEFLRNHGLTKVWWMARLLLLSAPMMISKWRFLQIFAGFLWKHDCSDDMQLPSDSRWPNFPTPIWNKQTTSLALLLNNSVQRSAKKLDPHWTTVMWSGGWCTMAALMMIYQAVPTLRFTATSGRFLFVSQKVA